jgi:hypothetical protein
LRKFSSILFLGLLFLNVIGYSIFTAWNCWENEISLNCHKQLEIKGDTLIFKYPISLPYNGNFNQEISEPETIIYEGEFYQSSKFEYISDTLITYYLSVNYSRENVISIINNFKNSITQDFSKEKDSSSQKALEFFKKMSKKYLRQNLVLTTLFWIEFKPKKSVFVSEIYSNPSIEVNLFPPDSLSLG